jgi:DNA topoisomerase VI subunit A
MLKCKQIKLVESKELYKWIFHTLPIIVNLLKEESFTTKREMFYTNQELFNYNQVILLITLFYYFGVFEFELKLIYKLYDMN